MLFLQERGYCQTESSCAKIHSVDLIIISEETIQSKKSRKRSRKRRRQSESVVATEDAQSNGSFQEENSNGKAASKKAKNENQEEELVLNCKSETAVEDSFIEHSLPRMKGHRAGFDAFMTGYCFACYQTELENSKNTTIEESRNKIYLTAKDMPLTILKSHFVKTSSNHRTIMADLLK